MPFDTIDGKDWPEPLKCDLGCGPWKKEGFVGLDIRPFWEGENPKGKLKVNADIYCDLNKGIPFPNNSVSEIYASHFLEHVANIYDMLDECHRVLKKHSGVLIIVPLFETKSVDHITCFYPDWFERNISLPEARYKGKFRILEKDISLVNLEEEHRAFWILKIWLVKQ